MATAEIKTKYGVMKVEFYEKDATKTVENFVKYAKAGHYDGTIFHRVIPGFMIQGGGFDTDMKQKDTNPPIKIEADNGLKNTKGTVAMARTSDPNSATSQFFINIADNVNDGITIERVIYDCTTPLEHWKMNGADHIFLIPVVNDTSGAVITWNFLAQYNHPNPTLNIEKAPSKISVYPNPVNNILNIPIEEGIVELYNLNQQLIGTFILNNQQIELGHISKGTYLIKVIAKDQSVTHSLITKE